MQVRHPAPVRANWDGFVASAVIHAALILVLTTMLRQVDLGEGGPVQVIAVMDTEPAQLDLLADTAEGAEVDFTALTAIDPQSIVDDSRPTTSVAAAGGGMGGGGSGIQAGGPRNRGESLGPTGPDASFFGTVAYGDQFVYVLDVSSSMERKGYTNDSRLRRAAAELLRSVRALNDRQSFCVLLFSTDTRQTFDEANLIPSMFPATEDNKSRLQDWLQSVHPAGGTDPREALRLGLCLKPSAVFLLSDGEFNGDTTAKSDLLTSKDKVPKVVENYNAGQIPIHTIAYEDKANCRQMEQLANQTGGTYRFVAEDELGPDPSAGRLAARQIRRAKYLLDRAKALSTRGETRAARDMYRQVSREFPSTVFAQQAEQFINP